MLKIVAEGLGVLQGNIIQVNSGRFKVKNFSMYIENSDSQLGFNIYTYMLFKYPNYFIIKCAYNTQNLNNGKYIFILDGEFNCDMLSIINSSDGFGRVEIRNENDVLITDNGKPWSDGTYPPDAKNSAALSGLHAAPAVINPELETALMGDETNKERVQE